MIDCKEGYRLLMKWLIPFPTCIRLVGKASDSHTQACMSHNVRFLTGLTVKSLIKYHQILVTLVALGLECCDTRRDINYC